MNRLALRRALAAVWLTVACLPLVAVHAQDDETTARDAIAQAFAQLANADSYTYAMTFDTSTVLTDEDDATFGTKQAYDITGEASGADYHDTVTLTLTPLENEADAQSTTLERIQRDGVFYVQIDALLADELGIEPGWWTQDALLDTFEENTPLRLSAESLTTLPTPASLAFADDLIVSVSELEQTDIDGAPVRVFDVELNALAMMMAQAGEESALAQLAALVQDMELMLAAEYSATAQVAIGVDDGRLYRFETEARTFLPFLEMDGGSYPGYNIETSMNARYDITGYDVPVVVEAPEATQR